ncbi:MAG: hypothetical protein AB1726_10200 [Planctomycetota bacterium]
MERTTRMSFPRWPAIAAAAAILGLLACVARLGGAGGTPPQGWWEGRGPVVPHDSFPADCSLCHLGESWHTIRADFVYDHAAETGVALRGAHAAAECLRCHNDRGPVQAFADRGCGGCHEDVHFGQLGADCASCHDEEDWRPSAEIVSHQRTRFPLVGAHAAVACWRCHPGAQVGNFTGVDTECVTCHADNLARATEPDHLLLGYVEDCNRCHVPTTWGGAGFSHPGWPLTGAHRTLACEACHAGGVFTGTPTDCYACHADDYAAAADPNHVALNFPTSCEQCHSTRDWNDAVFDHAGIASGCVDCHLDDYQATTDPDHAASGFPTTCEDCHNTQNWNDATFDHDFPIDSGPHGSLDCADCHLDPGNFATFSCTHCHEHRQSEADSEHQDVENYVWESSACYNCHPDGRADD